MSGPGLIILAAGASKRMGRPKQLLPWQGKTLLRHACETALAASLSPVMVVLGCETAACESELIGLDVHPVTNYDWSRGMGTSVACGIAALERQYPEATGALVMLVDQPDLTASFLRSILGSWMRGDGAIVATQYGEGGGVPALFSKSYFPELKALDSDRGARQIISREKSVVLVQPAEALTDLDTPELFQQRVADTQGGRKEERQPGAISLKQVDPTILVIEDNRDDQDMLIRQLQKSGVKENVMCVADGTDAMALVRTGAKKLSAVCAIFLDLSLPGVNGLLLLQAIRANVETSLLPVFVMTGSTDPNDEAESRRLGATSFIPKQLLSLPSFRAKIAELFPSVKISAKESVPTD